MGRLTSRVSKVLMTGRLAPFEDAYRAELRERGYTVRSTVCELRQVARLSCWLAAGGLTVTGLTGARVDEFLVWQCAEGRYRSQRSRPGLMCLLGVLRGLGVLVAEEPAARRGGSGRRDGRGAARGRERVGRRGAELRVGAAIVSAVLLHRGAGRLGLLAGGAVGERSVGLDAAEGDQQGGRSCVAGFL